eukprot:scaffold3613_cov331-Prasinococcus_capsulatus_cf.AAC.4
MEPCGSTGSRTVTGVSPSLLQLKVTLRSSGSSSLLAAPAAACCGGGRRRVPPCASAPPSVGLQAALPASTDGTPSSSGARRWRFACMYSSRKGALSGTCSNPSYPPAHPLRESGQRAGGLASSLMASSAPSWVRRKRGCTWPSRTTSGATTSFILATRGPCTTCTPESVAMSTPGVCVCGVGSQQQRSTAAARLPTWDNGGVLGGHEVGGALLAHEEVQLLLLAAGALDHEGGGHLARARAQAAKAQLHHRRLAHPQKRRACAASSGRVAVAAGEVGDDGGPAQALHAVHQHLPHRQRRALRAHVELQRLLAGAKHVQVRARRGIALIGFARLAPQGEARLRLTAVHHVALPQ